MALKAKSLIVYGLEIRDDNRYIPFRADSGGPELTAVIRAGFYSLTGIAVAIKNAMEAADAGTVYDVTVDRTANGNTENRITISTSNPFLELLFSSGTLAASSIRDLLSFGINDYTGATSYQNVATSGVSIVSEEIGYRYEPPEVNVKNFGSVQVAASGEKEAITWSIQRFIGVEFKYEPEAKVLTDWSDLISWMIEQKPFDITMEITSPNTVYEVTLEKSSSDGKGLGFNMREMLPSFPFFYQTGRLKFRVRGGL